MDYRGITIILLASAIWSCRSVKYVPVETVKTDSVYVNKVQRDSIRLQDSIFVFVKGDTVRIEKYKYLYRDRVGQGGEGYGAVGGAGQRAGARARGEGVVEVATVETGFRRLRYGCHYHYRISGGREDGLQIEKITSFLGL